MSLLLANGHTNAARYPIGFLWDEVELVVQRENALIATNLTLTQLAIGSVLSKKSGAAFRERIKALLEE